MKSFTWDHSTISINENIWTWQTNVTLFTLQGLNALNVNISVTLSLKIYVSLKSFPGKWKVLPLVTPDFQDKLIYRLISKSYLFKMVAQGRPEAWHSIENLSRTRELNFILEFNSRTMYFWAWETYHRSRQHGCTWESRVSTLFSTLSRPGTLLLLLSLLVDDAMQRKSRES